MNDVQGIFFPFEAVLSSDYVLYFSVKILILLQVSPQDIVVVSGLGLVRTENAFVGLV